MIGSRQMETLQKYAKWVTEAREPVTVHVKVRPWRRFTREEGGGSGYPVVMVFGYVVDNETEGADYMSTCKEKYTAIEKAKEIARFLRDNLNVPGDKIKVRDES